MKREFTHWILQTQILSLRHFVTFTSKNIQFARIQASHNSIFYFCVKNGFDTAGGNCCRIPELGSGCLLNISLNEVIFLSIRNWLLMDWWSYLESLKCKKKLLVGQLLTSTARPNHYEWEAILCICWNQERCSIPWVSETWGSSEY